MVVLQYPAVLEKDDNGTWLVTFPEFDDAVTFGDTRQEALAQAAGKLPLRPRRCGQRRGKGLLAHVRAMEVLTRAAPLGAPLSS